MPLRIKYDAIAIVILYSLSYLRNLSVLLNKRISMRVDYWLLFDDEF